MEKVYLAAANGYSEMYYIDEKFCNLPSQVKEEIKSMLVYFAYDIGGIIALYFDEKGNLKIELNKNSDDFFYDEIGAEVKIGDMRRTKKELFSALETYYLQVVKGLKYE